ncbi:programmed cell death 1 ligand 1-like [Pelobates fuscus]|uniref:programmed cell death 1 ligand 1-like n=1 Tax=Pelobates fuscus TaxID=191477 RepID=UPI002FE4A16B
MLVFLFFILITSNLHPTSALFVVKANKMKHIARYGDIVQLVCNFPVNDNFNMDQLKASWEYINSTSSLRVEILRLNNGKIELLDHKRAHNRRITMLMDELRNGQAVLEITHVKLSDAGTYRCVLQLGGSDYDVTTLDVQEHESHSTIQTITTIVIICGAIFLTFVLLVIYWKRKKSFKCFRKKGDQVTY